MRTERWQPTVALRPQGTEVMERSVLQPPVTNEERWTVSVWRFAIKPHRLSQARRIEPVSSRRISFVRVLLSVATINSAQEPAGTRDSVFANSRQETRLQQDVLSSRQSILRAPSGVPLLRHAALPACRQSLSPLSAPAAPRPCLLNCGTGRQAAGWERHMDGCRQSYSCSSRRLSVGIVSTMLSLNE